MSTMVKSMGKSNLGEQGKVPYDILKYYYGNDIELVTAEKVAGSPQSYPGHELTIGSSGPACKNNSRSIK